MENHPIPQDVTGFQFRLIGDMTVKQFAYVAAGAIVAFGLFYMPLSPFIKYPLILLSGGFGAALAFLPIEGRPFDVMFGYFAKALLTPNQYAYHKIGGSIALFTLASPQPSSGTLKKLQLSEKDATKAQQLQQYLQTVHPQSSSALDQREDLLIHQALSSQPLQPTQLAPTSPVNLPGPSGSDAPVDAKEIEEEEVNLSLQAASLKHELDDVKEKETKEQDAKEQQVMHQKVMDLEKHLRDVVTQKETLEKELQALKAQTKPATPVAATQTPPQPTPVAPTPAPPAVQATPAPAPVQVPSAEPTIRKIPADMAKSIGLPRMPDVPNLIVGIVKDPRNNVLQNILVEVKDKDGIPARAFRTNSLGQFASATPLSNGTYTIDFEDPRKENTFDTVELVAKGEIMLPLEIISHDEREELRKALFS